MDKVGNYIGHFSQTEKSLNDHQIISKVKIGQTNLYEILIRRYNERLFHIARSYLNEDYDIEEVLQETYIKAYENLSQFEGRAKFSTWITRILINNCLARLKQQKRFSNVEITKLISDEDENFNALIRQQNQEEKIIEKNLKEVLEFAIDRLPDNYRVVFIMRVLENISIKDTSESLGITPENVKIRLFRAKKLLRNFLYPSLNELNLFDFHLNRCDRITKAVLKSIEVL